MSQARRYQISVSDIPVGIVFAVVGMTLRLCTVYCMHSIPDVRHLATLAVLTLLGRLLATYISYDELIFI